MQTYLILFFARMISAIFSTNIAFCSTPSVSNKYNEIYSAVTTIIFIEVQIIYYMFRLQSSTCMLALKKIIIITIIIRHELGLSRPVSASSNGLFKGLPSRLRPFGPHFSIIFGILLLILLTCRSQFDFNLLSFSSTGSIFNSSKIYSFLLCSSRLTSIFFVRFSKGPISLPYKRMGTANVLNTFILENFWTNVG